MEEGWMFLSSSCVHLSLSGGRIFVISIISLFLSHNVRVVHTIHPL